MVYGRRRYRSRRAGRRGNRTLSTRNIFNNKSSRAQAAQLYRLNRKVNSVYRQCKPELKIKVTQPQTFAFTAYNTSFSDLSNLMPNFQSPMPSGHVLGIEMPVPGAADSDFTGNVCNLKDATVYLNTFYELIKDTRLNSLPNIVSDQAFVRYIFVLSKVPTDEYTDPDEIFDLQNASFVNADMGRETLGIYPAGYRMNTVLPLKEGTASKYTIIKDVRVKLGVLTPEKQLKVKLPLSRYGKYIRNEYTIYGKCTLHCFAICSGLEVKGVPDAQGQYIYAVPRVTTNWFTKIAYTDP